MRTPSAVVCDYTLPEVVMLTRSQWDVTTLQARLVYDMDGASRDLARALSSTKDFRFDEHYLLFVAITSSTSSDTHIALSRQPFAGYNHA